MVAINLANVSKFSPVLLEDFVNGNMDFMRQSFPSFRLLEAPKPTWIDGNSALEFTYTYMSEVLQDEIKEVQRMALKDGIIYGIAFHSSLQTFDSYVPIYRQMAESYQINK